MTTGSTKIVFTKKKTFKKRDENEKREGGIDKKKKGGGPGTKTQTTQPTAGEMCHGSYPWEGGRLCVGEEEEGIVRVGLRRKKSIKPNFAEQKRKKKKPTKKKQKKKKKKKKKNWLAKLHQFGWGGLGKKKIGSGKVNKRSSKYIFPQPTGSGSLTSHKNVRARKVHLRAQKKKSGSSSRGRGRDDVQKKRTARNHHGGQRKRLRSEPGSLATQSNMKITKRKGKKGRG